MWCHAYSVIAAARDVGVSSFIRIARKGTVRYPAIVWSYMMLEPFNTSMEEELADVFLLTGLLLTNWGL